jgi:hypothetical protein
VLSAMFENTMTETEEAEKNAATKVRHEKCLQILE